MGTIFHVTCLLISVDYVLSALTVLTPADTLYRPLTPFPRTNLPDIHIAFGNIQPNVKYGITPQFFPSSYPMTAVNNIMRTSSHNRGKSNLPILINGNSMPLTNYPVSFNRLSMTRIPTYSLQMQKFPLPLMSNFPVTQMNLPAYIPYPILIRQEQMETNEENTDEPDQMKADNNEKNDSDNQKTVADEDFMESGDDAVILNSPIKATSIADEKKDGATEQTKGIVGDIISFIPFLPVEINVPDLISGIGGGIGWIINGIGGWIPFFNRPSTTDSTEARFAFALGPDGAPFIIPVDSVGFETAVGDDAFLY